MKRCSSVCHLVLLLLLGLTNTLLISGADTSHHHHGRKSYIVYMGHRHEGESPIGFLHMTLLQNVLGNREAAESCLLHSYKRSFNGFVAMLTDEEAHIISGLEEVVSVFPNGQNELQTTRSWDFIGFPQNVTRAALESNITIGVIDSGIWPESESFKDDGFGAPPAKWNGSCVAGFPCNNKIIGARYYRLNGKFPKNDSKSPRDDTGHGSHCASIAAGNAVGNVSLYGFARGTARGGVPSARIAVYKACWLDNCFDADVLAAFDDAIADGVDIISASLGSRPNLEYFNSVNSIGSFHAMQKGILTSIAAGNSGSAKSTIENFEPWTISVAATTIDRKFNTRIQLGNNKSYEGISINTFDMQARMHPLIYGGAAPNTAAGFNSSQSSKCLENSLDSKRVQGKIVLCDSINEKGPFSAGAYGAIFSGHYATDKAQIFPLNASFIGYAPGREILSYINSTTNPNATIYKSVEKTDALAPRVATFSSRGPNPKNPDIFKPDIAAPGVHILAAWSRNISMSKVTGDSRFVSYNIASGTSMACPHVSAIAAYVKSFNPTWSPAAIKSAIMTTANSMSATLDTKKEFSYGSGHINPLKAVKPGLVYDANEADYVQYLCDHGYNSTTIQKLTNKPNSCTAPPQPNRDLNYPAFAIPTPKTRIVNRTLTRTVTNVGLASSVYRLQVVKPSKVNIAVTPNVLTFTSLGQKKSYTVSVNGTLTQEIESASLIWNDGTYQVRSPIVMFTS